jgi:hypothetical protein
VTAGADFQLDDTLNGGSDEKVPLDDFVLVWLLEDMPKH